jgi:hypothetical protein
LYVTLIIFSISFYTLVVSFSETTIIIKLNFISTKFTPRDSREEKKSEKSTREEKKLEAINKLIARMEAKEKRKQEPGPSRTPKPRNQKKKFLTAPLVPSSDSDSEAERERQRSTMSQYNLPGPSSYSFRGTTSTSVAPEVPPPNYHPLLDLRKMEKLNQNPNKREKRWESDDGEDTEPEPQSSSLRVTLVNNAGESDSSSSASSEHERGEVGSSGFGRGISGLVASSGSFFDPVVDHPESGNSTSSSEHLFAPESHSSSSSYPETLFGTGAGRSALARGGLGSPSASPPRLRPRMDLYEPNPMYPEEGVPAFGERPRLGMGAEGLPRRYSYRVPNSSDEEAEAGLLDLSIASELGTAHRSRASDSGSSHRGLGDGYWSEANDWMLGGSG